MDVLRSGGGVPVQGSGAVEAAAAEVQREDGVAVHRSAGQALDAMAARLVGEGDVVAGRHRGHGGADPADDAGALMAQNGRQRYRKFLIPDVDVGLA